MSKIYRPDLVEARPQGMASRVQPRSAFTLVEMLVVIAIITVLISVLLPALSKARAQAQSIQCMSNLRQCAMAFMLYANDNQQKIIVQATNGGAYGSWPSRMYGYDWWGNWSGLCYLTNDAVRYCPSNAYAIDDALSTNIMANHIKYHTTALGQPYGPNWAGDATGYGIDTGSPITTAFSTGVNWVLSPTAFQSIYTDFQMPMVYGSYPTFNVVNLTYLSSHPQKATSYSPYWYYSTADKTVMLADSAYSSGSGLTGHCAAASLRWNAYYGCCIQLTHGTGQPGSGLANAAFYDGHVESLTDNQLEYSVGNHFTYFLTSSLGQE